MQAVKLCVTSLLVAMALAPFAGAQDNTTNDVDVNLPGGDGAQESTPAFGMSTTVVIVLVVLAVLVVALIVAMAGRDTP